MNSHLLAQGPTLTPFINPTSFPASRFVDVSSLLNIITPLLLIGAAIGFGAMFVWMGFTVLTAGDDKDKIAQAQKTLAFAVIGLVVVMSAYLIVRLLGYILNVSNAIPI